MNSEVAGDPLLLRIAKPRWLKACGPTIRSAVSNNRNIGVAQGEIVVEVCNHHGITRS
jgi:hypothetical protein